MSKQESSSDFLPLFAGQLAPGIWRTDQLPDDTAAQIRSAGLFPIVLTLAAETTKAELLTQLAESACFPPHFGHNWDAAADCLQDLSWLPAAGYVVVGNNAGGFAASQPNLSEVLLDVLLETVDHWVRFGTNFHVLWEAPVAFSEPSDGDDEDHRLATLPEALSELGTVTPWPTPNTSNEP